MEKGEYAHYVFKSHLLQGRQKASICGKDSTLISTLLHYIMMFPFNCSLLETPFGTFEKMHLLKMIVDNVEIAEIFPIMFNPFPHIETF